MTKIDDYLEKDCFGSKLMLSRGIDPAHNPWEFSNLLELCESKLKIVHQSQLFYPSGAVAMQPPTKLDPDDLIGRIGTTWWTHGGDIADKFVIVYVHPCQNVIGVIFPKFKQIGNVLTCHRTNVNSNNTVARSNTSGSHVESLGIGQILVGKNRKTCFDATMFDVPWRVWFISLNRPWSFVEWQIWLGGDLLRETDKQEGNSVEHLCDADRILSIQNSRYFLSPVQLNQIDREFWK